MATTERALIATPAGTIVFASTKWAWVDRGRPRIPTGSLCLLAGREATNKSTWAASLAASISTGELEGAWQGRPRSVLYASTEDSWPRTIGPRLAAAGAVLPDDVERLADKIETGAYGHFNKAQVQDALTAISGSWWRRSTAGVIAEVSEAPSIESGIASSS